jgi:hypothetical protein
MCGGSGSAGKEGYFRGPLSFGAFLLGSKEKRVKKCVLGYLAMVAKQ